MLGEHRKQWPKIILTLFRDEHFERVNSSNDYVKYFYNLEDAAVSMLYHRLYSDMYTI